VATFVHAENSPVPSVNVVPRPVSVKSLVGTFKLNDHTRILAVDNKSRRIAGLFNDFLLNQHGLHLHMTATRPKGENHISFSQAGGRGLPEEGYRLVIEPENIRVTGQVVDFNVGWNFGERQDLNHRPVGYECTINRI
jgi:hypothetical protein